MMGRGMVVDKRPRRRSMVDMEGRSLRRMGSSSRAAGTEVAHTMMGLAMEGSRRRVSMGLVVEGMEGSRGRMGSIDCVAIWEGSDGVEARGCLRG